MVYTRSMYGRLGMPLLSHDSTFSFEGALAEGVRNQDSNEHEDFGIIGDGADTQDPYMTNRFADPDTLEASSQFTESDLSSDGSLSPPLSLQSSPRASPINLINIKSPSSCSIVGVSSDVNLISEPEKRFENSQKRKNKKRSKENRKRKRMKLKEEGKPKFKRPSAQNSLRMKHVATAVSENIDFDLKSLPISKPGYVGTKGDRGQIYGLQELLDSEMGFRVIEWNGSDSRPIISDGRVIGVLVGRPCGSDWASVHEAAFNKIMDSATKCRFSMKATHHRRGDYPTLAHGISHGGGQIKPGNLVHDQPNLSVLQDLINDPHIARLAGFADGAFRTWAPELYEYYRQHFTALLEHDPSLIPNWVDIVWACIGINFGAQTITRKHKDQANLAFGVCSITPLGKFDHTLGGHLVLWPLKLVIQFPTGCTILIPSASIAHSNIPIQKSEQRCSIVQFSAGGLFRWVDYGFQPMSAYMANRDAAMEEQRMEEQKKLGLSLFSQLKTLQHAE